MKQILQSLATGATTLAHVPSPAVAPGQLLVRTTASVVSAGTERMLLEFGKAGLVGKAMQQPERVRLVLDKARTDGLAATLDAVGRKLDQPLALGYCNVGHVVGVGAGVHGFAVGDRVASNGRHAEMISVPPHLAARIPDGVTNEEAAFTVLGAIALHGIRLAAPTLGEIFAVSGLGLVGLLTVQLLRAHGCRVLGLDFDARRLALARQFGAETVNLANLGADPVRAAETLSAGYGVDGVIVTASTKSSEPMHQAAQMCRKRGRIVLVGVTGLELRRADFYEKELTFQVSCSYGPGRYDSSYEMKGIDYPIGYVRWTEQRNFEAVLQMLAEKRLEVGPLISHRFAFEDAEQAYELLGSGGDSLGILLNYSTGLDDELLQQTVSVTRPASVRAAAGAATGGPTVGVIGAGNYASAILLPALKASGARIKSVASATGISAAHAAQKFGADAATTDVAALIGDDAIDAVVIATRHDTHADLVVRALAAGKHVYVEKPLALSLAEIDDIAAAYQDANSLLMVGFNRRFAPQVARLRELLGGSGEPKSMVMTVNAGPVPNSHWTQDRGQGGGRLVGEACHFIDLLRYLAGAPIDNSRINRLASGAGDTATIELAFADGSIGTIHYFANGTNAFPKERLEVFSAGRVLQIDNFRALNGFGFRNFRSQRQWRQDKGQAACIGAFIDAVARGGPSPIPFDEIVEVSRTAVALQDG